MFSIIFYVFLTFTSLCDSARILVVIPTPAISHQVAYRPFTLELAKRGHEVVVITTDPIFSKSEAPVNYTEINVHDISYELWKAFIDTMTGESDLLAQFKVALQQIEFIFEQQLQTSEVQKLLNNKEEKFDLLFIECWVKSTLAFTHIFKVPTIQISTLGPLPGVHETAGAPTHPLLYPLPFRKKVRNLSLWEKNSEYYFSYLFDKMYADNEAVQNQNLKRIFGLDFPTLNELKRNIDMIFLNVNSLWDFNRPVPPNVIYLGGLHRSPPKSLPQKLKSYLDSSTNGVIYMSLGTNINPSILPRQMINVFLKVFATLPYNVLWKWDLDELEGRSNNINISKWFPQPDLLWHPNVKLFITQGGLQSTDEAITAGVPLIGIPILADQWYNAELYEYHKIGIRLDIETLTEESLMNAIKTILKDGSYRDNVVRFGNLIRDQPQTSLERAIWWTEYVLRHGGAQHLRSPAANITWTEYFELQLVAVVLGSFLFGIAMTVFVIKLSIRLFFPCSKMKSD